MVDAIRNISFNGRDFDRRQLLAATPQLIAERLAFPVDYQSANRRLDGIVRGYQHRAFQGGLLSFRRDPLDPKQEAQALVWNLESGYDPENENTLEQVATLIARHPDFLARHGIADNSSLQEMLLTAAGIEVRRATSDVKESGGAQYYGENLRAFRAIEHELQLLTSAD